MQLKIQNGAVDLSGDRILSSVNIELMTVAVLPLWVETVAVKPPC